jgi:outer membrane PBP1 activator LpoA protein
MPPVLPYWFARSTAALLAAGALALGIAGCSTVSVQGPGAAPHQPSPAIAQASELARRDASLAGTARQDNAAQIARLLAGLDDATLAREAAALPAGDPLYNFAGRALLQRGLPLPRPFDRGNGAPFGADGRPPADRDGYRPPVKLAVLLPLSGDLSRAAVPVRDGLLAGYYGEARRRPEIVFYDTAGTPAGAIAAYQRASGEGADLVVGPLGRDEVGALFHQALPVPVLALNRGNVDAPAGSASFSLAPEDDGVAAAEFMQARGARRVLVLADGDDGMRRAVGAFREQLEARGGSVVAALAVSNPVADMGGALRAAAQSQGGVDAVLLAVKPAQARALAPQLAQAGLGGKLRVGTSQLAAGGGDANHALDGIAFPNEAWNVRGTPGLPGPAESAKLLPSARGPAARLFAFGHDAWRLAGHLEFLATHPDAKLQGATGLLRLDGFGNVVRTPAWSGWNGASVVPVADAGH